MTINELYRRKQTYPHIARDQGSSHAPTHYLYIYMLLRTSLRAIPSEELSGAAPMSEVRRAPASWEKQKQARKAQKSFISDSVATNTSTGHADGDEEAAFEGANPAR